MPRPAPIQTEVEICSANGKMKVPYPSRYEAQAAVRAFNKQRKALGLKGTTIRIVSGE